MKVTKQLELWFRLVRACELPRKKKMRKQISTTKMICGVFVPGTPSCCSFSFPACGHSHHHWQTGWSVLEIYFFGSKYLQTAVVNAAIAEDRLSML